MVSEERRPTRDYVSLSETPWSFWDVLYSRRSHRRYSSGGLDEAGISSLQEVITLSAAARGAEPGSVELVTERESVRKVQKAASRGLKGGINRWLGRTEPAGFAALRIGKDDLEKDRPSETPLSVMVLEDIVLWLTEAGLGTCWLAGFNDSVVSRALGLRNGESSPALVVFGNPGPEAGAGSYESITRAVMTRRRKPLPKIASLERVGSPYRAPELSPGVFRAYGRQDVKGLLERLESGVTEREVPPALAVDACLESARVAPSGGNMQAWHFIAVMDGSKLKALEGACKGAEGWTAAIVAAGRRRGFEPILLDKPFWMLDVPIALSHVSLMAASMGCAVEVAVEDIDEPAVNDLVGMEKGMRAVGVVGIE